MRKITVAAAFLAFASCPAGAELLKNFKYDGKIEVHAYKSSNQDWAADVFDGTYSDVDTRLQINASFDLNEDAEAVVSVVKNDRQYDSTGGSQSLDTISKALFFEQAHVLLRGVMGLDHRIGRQYYGDEGSIVMYYGPTSWPYEILMPVVALDGYTAMYSSGGQSRNERKKWSSRYRSRSELEFSIHALLAKENNFNNTPDEDRDISGIRARCEFPENVKLSAYFYQRKYQTGTSVRGPDDRLQAAGMALDGAIVGFEYSAEAVRNLGRANRLRIPTADLTAGETRGKYTGYAFKSALKYEFESAARWNVSGEYAFGTGDNSIDRKVSSYQAVRSDYRPTIIRGYDSADGLTNLKVLSVGGGCSPMEKLDLKARLVKLDYQKEVKSGTRASKTIGNEMNFTAAWNHNRSIALKGYYALFNPTSKYAKLIGGTLAENDSETLFGGVLSVKF